MLAQNKERFIQEVISEELVIMNKKESLIVDDLITRGYAKDVDRGDYDYLLRMHIRTFTLEKINKLKMILILMNGNYRHYMLKNQSKFG